MSILVSIMEAIHTEQSNLLCLKSLSFVCISFGALLITFHPKISLASCFPEKLSPGWAEKAASTVSCLEMYSSTWLTLFFQKAFAGSGS